MVFEHEDALPESCETVNRLQGNTRHSAEYRDGSAASDELIGKDRFCTRSQPKLHGKQVGYIRVSTKAQTIDRQILQLQAECDELQIEHISAIAAERPVFDTILAGLRPGDALVVLDLDRAFRSSIDAMLTAESLRSRGIRFRILALHIDTETAEGELFYTILAAFAQFERRIISRRTREGMEAARRRGSKIGRPRTLSQEVVRDAYDWIEETGLPCAYVSALLGVSRLTLQRGFHRMGLRYPM